MNVAALAKTFPGVTHLPVSLLIVLENLLRHEDGVRVTQGAIASVAERSKNWGAASEILFQPSRIVMQDYAGLVALIDLATMRERFAAKGGDPASLAPVKPVDLVIDHSLMVNHARALDSAERNLTEEYALNADRFTFAKWAQQSLPNLRVVPPGNGIIHQVNLEHFAEVVREDPANGLIHPESQIGTDSHTTMINGLGVLAWGVGGIEAAGSMLGEPVSMLVPDVIGVRLTGQARPGTLSTDIVLTITEILRARGVVDRFVEFFGPGLGSLPVGDRATIANMAPEYGATCGYFPIDQKTIDYLRLTSRDEAAIARVSDYAKFAGLWANNGETRDYADVVEIDLSAIGRVVAGPKRPHDRMDLGEVNATVPEGKTGQAGLRNGDIVIAAITSCTNTSNPRSMIAAGLLARNAVAKGLQTPARVKTTLSPGSRAVVQYLSAAGLMPALEQLGFATVGFGCATCVGNTGPLDKAMEADIKAGDLSVAAVLSGNRNFEGRIHASVKLNYLASPPLVVAYALAGSMRRNLEKDPLGKDVSGAPIYLRYIWPDESEIESYVARFVTPDAFRETRADIFSGGARWDALPSQPGPRFPWSDSNTYIGPSPFVEAMLGTGSIVNAAPLLVLGDNVTTDHISPVGTIGKDSPAADYLRGLGVMDADFNAYGARRGNPEVMARGTFANPRLKNELVTPREGGWTKHGPSGEVLPIYGAAIRYRGEGTPVIVVAGKNYGAGSARDWAAKGTVMLGIRAVLAESFERIHRANLVLMGVLPLQFEKGDNRLSLGITAESRITIHIPEAGLTPRQLVDVTIGDGRGIRRVQLRSRVDTALDAEYFAAGGVLPFVLHKLTETLSASAT